MEMIYFYPETEETGRVRAAKRHLFGKVSLNVRELGDCGEMRLRGCAVPSFYYRKKVWRPRELAAAMECAFDMAGGADDTFLHPQIAAMLTEEYAGRWQPDAGTVELLTGFLVSRYAAKTVLRCGEADVLLGEADESERQMKMTCELLQPYLPRINRLLVFSRETAEDGMREALGECLDDYYYEYGLVPQTETYMTAGDEPRCGRAQCGGMILDYGERFAYPKIAPCGGAVYIDMVSSKEKESLLRRRAPRVTYVSPLKYLDTMVKNSYDRLVN